MKEHEEQTAIRSLIPAEPNEVSKFPCGTRISGTIGGLSEKGIIVFIPDENQKVDPVFANSCGGGFNCGDQGFAVMAIDEKTKIEYWRFENGN